MYGRDMMLARGKKKKRPSDEEVDGGKTHDVRDESGGAEGCGGESGLVEKIMYVHVRPSVFVCVCVCVWMCLSE